MPFEPVLLFAMPYRSRHKNYGGPSDSSEASCPEAIGAVPLGPGWQKTVRKPRGRVPIPGVRGHPWLPYQPGATRRPCPPTNDSEADATAMVSALAMKTDA
jgi:hypothetical protein